MDIAFRDTKMKKIFDSGKRLKKEYGRDRAKKIQQRLDELNAAPSLADMGAFKAARCHSLSGNMSGEFAVDLDQPYRLVFQLDHDPVPETESGGIDRAKVSKIVITRVIDYH